MRDAVPQVGDVLYTQDGQEEMLKRLDDLVWAHTGTSP